MVAVSIFFRIILWILCHVWAFALIMLVLWIYAGPAVPISILDFNLAMMLGLTKLIAALGPEHWGWIFQYPYEMLSSLVDGIKQMTTPHEFKVPFVGKKSLGLGKDVELLGRIVAEGIPLYLELKLIRFVAWCCEVPRRIRAWREARGKKDDVLQAVQYAQARFPRRSHAS